MSLKVQAEATTSRQPKHAAIDERLGYLETILERHQLLINDITGLISPEVTSSAQLIDPANTKKLRPLAGVLSEAPDRIHDIASRLDDQIQQLREALF
jgi:hypothetical protein